jgi:acyl carrier protein
MIRHLLKLLTAPSPDQASLLTERRLKWNDGLSVEAKVKEIVAEVVGLELGQITSEALIYRLGSSNDALEVIMQCEEDFGIEIPDGEAEQCETIGRLATYIQEKLNITHG